MTLSRESLSLPLAALFAVFFLAPLAVLLGLSFSNGVELRPQTLSHYVTFFTDPFSLKILWGTLLLGVKATLLCLAFGYPIAWICVRSSARVQSLLLLIVTLPILTSVVVRTFAWIVILGRQGVLNKLAMGMGLIDDPLNLLFTEAGVVLVLAQVQLPLMVLPIVTVMAKADPNLEMASRALGAGEWRTLLRVTLPLSLPGVLAGCTLTYAASVTAFVTQTLIGGARLIYMPLYIYQQAVGANAWPVAACVSVIFMVAVMGVIFVMGKLGQRSRAYA
jgi:putative spermidine/putrescine transport system permease protein